MELQTWSISQTNFLKVYKNSCVMEIAGRTVSGMMKAESKIIKCQYDDAL